MNLVKLGSAHPVKNNQRTREIQPQLYRHEFFNHNYVYTDTSFSTVTARWVSSLIMIMITIIMIIIIMITIIMITIIMVIITIIIIIITIIMIIIIIITIIMSFQARQVCLGWLPISKMFPYS